MNLRKKFLILVVGIVTFSVVSMFFFQKFMRQAVSSFMPSFSTVPVFNSGAFTDDGRYFAYTYTPEIERPDIDANITMRGFGYPAYFQVMETATGKIVAKQIYETGKSEQLYVVCTEGNTVWLMETVNHNQNRIALFDMESNAFKFRFGELEKLNPSVLNGKSRFFFVNSTAEKGLLLEGMDSRYYRIDPNTGKAAVVNGNLEPLNYSYATDFHTSKLYTHVDYRVETINGNRKSITDKTGKIVSEDDFIAINFLTLTKNKVEDNQYAPITYYKHYFFVLSPLLADNEADMELVMIDSNTLETAWKLQLPQKEQKTFIPRYGYERFFLKGNELFIANNDYLLKIDLDQGILLSTTSLYTQN